MTLHRLTPLWFTLFSSLVFMLLLGAWPGLAHAGCKLNVYIHNQGTDLLEVSEIKVKVRGGLWKKFSKWWKIGVPGGMWFEAGEKKGGSYDATFNCQARRRYQVGYQCKSGKSIGGIWTDYYPSSSTWTRNQTVSIPLPRCK